MGFCWDGISGKQFLSEESLGGSGNQEFESKDNSNICLEISVIGQNTIFISLSFIPLR